MLVLSNTPRQHKTVVGIVKGAEARGFRLVASDVVEDARGPSIAMVCMVLSSAQFLRPPIHACKTVSTLCNYRRAAAVGGT